MGDDHTTDRPSSTARQRIDPNMLKRSHFYFGKTLGEGSFARVIHAKLKSEKSPQFAIKIMEKAFIAKENKKQFVMTEKKVMSILSSEYFIKLYYTFQDDDYLYMCMDLVPGGELRKLIQDAMKSNQAQGLIGHACDVTTTQFYIAEVLEALEYMHSMDIVHMDLKPENILISRDGHIKLGDFGTALILAQLTEEAMQNLGDIGTAEYVSPEAMDRSYPLSKACDLWAVGCITYQMLIGVTPFYAPTEFLICEESSKYISGARGLDFGDHVTVAARDLIEGFLRGDPSTRLGAGTPESGLGYEAVKAHAFFQGTAWGSLLSSTPPHSPDPSTFPSTEDMHDGAHDDWMMEGEATPIITDTHKQKTLQNSSLDDVKWNRFLQPGEEKAFHSIVSKRVGLFSKVRCLILTKTPRLIYVDPESMQEKGEIFWSHEHPVSCVMKDHATFDVICSKTKRAYHFTDLGGVGAQTWIMQIQALAGGDSSSRKGR